MITSGGELGKSIDLELQVYLDLGVLNKENDKIDL
jgi:hypothetical protein